MVCMMVADGTIASTGEYHSEKAGSDPPPKSKLQATVIRKFTPEEGTLCSTPLYYQGYLHAASCQN
eukprot:scaffold48192_cov88-Cyclotella_meneghiniana.AAC.4